MSQQELEDEVRDQYFELLGTVIEGFSEDTGRAPSVDELENCLMHALPHANSDASLEDWWYASELLHSIELFRNVRGSEIADFEPVLADVFEHRLFEAAVLLESVEFIILVVDLLLQDLLIECIETVVRQGGFLGDGPYLRNGKQDGI